MKLLFEGKDDERMRLDRTICRWNGEPVLVTTDFDLDLYQVMVKRLKKGARTIEVDCSDPRFDARAPRLGYFERASSVYWMIRTPARQYKAGLPIRRSLYIRDISNRINHGENDLPVMPDLWMMGPQMHDALMGYNRTWDEAIEEARYGEGAAVVNRDFAVLVVDRRRIAIFYCGREVGYFSGDQPQLFGGPDASFIHRAMERIKQC